MPRDRHIGGYKLRTGQFVPSLIKSIQRATIDVTSGTSNTATITSVNTERARLRFLGVRITGSEDSGMIRLALTNGTTVTATRFSDGGGTTAIVSFEVTEFFHGVIKRIQRGTVTVNAASATGTATITAVNTAKAELSYLGLESADSTPQEGQAYIDLTNTTTITATRNTAGAGALTVGYEVVEWF